MQRHSRFPEFKVALEGDLWIWTRFLNSRVYNLIDAGMFILQIWSAGSGTQPCYKNMESIILTLFTADELGFVYMSGSNGFSLHDYIV